MSKRDEVKHRARYTLEFKLEAVRLVKACRRRTSRAGFRQLPCYV
jgi:transposase-like protein